ncbi:MAG: DUF6596 domain-containing protein [Streptosporangiaceae bacterium]
MAATLGVVLKWLPAAPAPAMRLVPLPDGVLTSPDQVDPFYEALSQRRVEVAPVHFDGHGYLRIAAAPYNTPGRLRPPGRHRPGATGPACLTTRWPVPRSPRRPPRGLRTFRATLRQPAKAALTLATEEPEARGLLALMLLNHARLPARLDPEGRIVTLDRQDRGLWDKREIAEGVRVLQSALAVQRPGRYQIEAAIAALHDDAANAEETDWPQILAWYDDLLALTGDPVRRDPAAVLARAVAVGHVLGAAAGLRETDRLREVLGERHRWHAVRGHLHELSDDLPAAATAYADAARRATDVAERDHLVRQAARARARRAM